MSNEQQNTREAAIEQAWKHFCGTYYDNHETVPVLYRTAIQIGFDAGAASVDRVEVVRTLRAIAHPPEGFRGFDGCACPLAEKLDAVIEAMEKGK